MQIGIHKNAISEKTIKQNQQITIPKYIRNGTQSEDDIEVLHMQYWEIVIGKGSDRIVKVYR